VPFAKRRSVTVRSEVPRREVSIEPDGVIVETAKVLIITSDLALDSDLLPQEKALLGTVVVELITKAKLDDR
jgi:hypothetical protein